MKFGVSEGMILAAGAGNGRCVYFSRRMKGQSRDSEFIKEKTMASKKSIEEIVKADKRYTVQAVSFVYEGLGYTAKNWRRQQAKKPSQGMSAARIWRGDSVIGNRAIRPAGENGAQPLGNKNNAGFRRNRVSDDLT